MKFFKKLIKKVKKGVKNVVRGVKKTFKKITSSKAFKVAVLVGALLVTGGTAIQAFGGKLATSKLGSMMVGTANSILTTPVVGTLAKPFAWLGTAAGTTAGTVTDFLNITSKAGRMGYTKVGDSWVVNKQNVYQSGSFKGKTLAEVKAAPKSSSNYFGLGKTVDSAGNVVNLKSGQIFENNAVRDLTTEELQNQGIDTTKYEIKNGNIVAKEGEEIFNPAVNNSLTGSPLGDAAVQAGVSTAVSVGGNYLLHQMTQGDPVGVSGASIGEEKGIDLSPVNIQYSEYVSNPMDAYKELSFGTGDVGFLMNQNLFKQDVVGVA